MKTFLIGILSLCCGTTFAATINIQMYTTADNANIGYVTAEDTRYGLELIPHLTGLTPGTHGFHIHQNPDCGDKGMAAGGHFDPAHEDKHLGPYNSKGHLGDLPALIVNPDGTATLPGVAPRLTTKMLHGHSLMIHVGGDNYADVPQKLGGGGARFACGVIK